MMKPADVTATKILMLRKYHSRQRTRLATMSRSHSPGTR